MSHAGIKVLMVCGGTGGHIYPAMAIADSLKRMGADQIVFAGRKDSMEEKLVAPYWNFETITAVPLVRGSLKHNLSLPWKLFTSYLRAKAVIRKVKPSFVVATGGYVSLPVILAAGIAHIPVYLQEQNAVAGVANRIGARFAKRIFVTSADAAKAFPATKCKIHGNPVRQMPTPGSLPVPTEFEKATFNVLVLGGSQGARGINEKLEAQLKRIGESKEITVVWQAGAKNVTPIQQRAQIPENVTITSFLNPVYAYMDSADLLVSRAGASTIAEILAFGKPSILFPFPFATANHQEFNARVLERAGAALVELDDEPNGLWDKVERLCNNPAELKQMAAQARSLGMPDAADRIAKDILAEELRA